MGLTPFPATLCLHLANLARAQVFIETGTYLGETARWAAKFFSDVRTVELGAERYADTSAALRDLSNVVCYQGDSRAVLAKLREEPEPTVQKDGIHLTIKGYRRLGDRMFEELMKGWDGQRQ